MKRARQISLDDRMIVRYSKTYIRLQQESGARRHSTEENRPRDVHQGGNDDSTCVATLRREKTDENAHRSSRGGSGYDDTELAMPRDDREGRAEISAKTRIDTRV